MAIILPANTITQTGFPVLTAALQQHFGSYTTPLYIVFVVGILSGISIALLPKKEKDPTDAALPLQGAGGHRAVR
jgi:ABC-type Mn2+/Zn2+ transport system permease subunit